MDNADRRGRTFSLTIPILIPCGANEYQVHRTKDSEPGNDTPDSAIVALGADKRDLSLPRQCYVVSSCANVIHALAAILVVSTYHATSSLELESTPSPNKLVNFAHTWPRIVILGVTDDGSKFE